MYKRQLFSHAAVYAVTGIFYRTAERFVAAVTVIAVPTACLLYTSPKHQKPHLQAQWREEIAAITARLS